MTIRNIIYIVENPPDQRDFERFGINYLLEQKEEIKIWDISFIKRGDIFDTFYQVEKKEGKIIRKFKEEQELVEAIQKLGSKDVVVIVLPYSSLRKEIWDALSFSKAYYGLLNNGGLCPMEYFHWNLIRLLRLVRHVKKFLKNRVKTKGKIFLPFVLTGTRHTLPKDAPINIRKTDIIYSHNFDYDIYLKNINKKPVLQYKYILFLDCFLPHHPDYNILKREKPVEPEEYYPHLNLFFQKVEKHFGFPVVIAAHPRSYYEKMENPFEGRLILRKETAVLVRDSEFVLSQMSFSSNFANIYHKSVIFVDIGSIRNRERRQIGVQASWFGKSPLDIGKKNKTINWLKELKISERHYREYKEKYIKTAHSLEKNTWVIFHEFLKNLRWS
ncbi:MAG: hypothetical protein OEV78_04980 [Spirochaetia bacterium]|nr:hypothetical protein [Spirochaetia bacterium]